MGRVVILEGPDGGGKTTLAKELVKAGFEYRHEGPPPPGVDLIAHYLRILYDSLLESKNVVHDRLWFGERIYGPIMRKEDRVGDEGQILFERLHRSKPIHQYICSPEFGIARSNYLEKIKEKDDYIKSEETWTSVFEEYSKLGNRQKQMGDFYDYNENSPSQVISRIMDYKVGLNSLPQGTIGSPIARYLFIGDKPNHLTIDVPFFSTRGSSGYLNKALKISLIKEDDLALTNAKSALGEKHVLAQTLVKLPSLKHVFLMGAMAKDWFQRETRDDDVSKYVVHEIPHPSFLRRFKGHNPQVMADLIIEKIYG